MQLHNTTSLVRMFTNCTRTWDSLLPIGWKPLRVWAAPVQYVNLLVGVVDSNEADCGMSLHELPSTVMLRAAGTHAQVGR